MTRCVWMERIGPLTYGTSDGEKWEKLSFPLLLSIPALLELTGPLRYLPDHLLHLPWWWVEEGKVPQTPAQFCLHGSGIIRQPQQWTILKKKKSRDQQEKSQNPAIWGAGVQDPGVQPCPSTGNGSDWYYSSRSKLWGLCVFSVFSRITSKKEAGRKKTYLPF